MRPENCLFVSEVSSTDNWNSKVVNQNVLEQIPVCIKNNGSEENSENSDDYVQNLVEKTYGSVEFMQKNMPKSMLQTIK